MAMYPTNTPLDKWLTIWIFHEVESIVGERTPKVKNKFDYSGMTPSERRAKDLPCNRTEAIAYIRKYRPHIT